MRRPSPAVRVALLTLIALGCGSGGDEKQVVPAAAPGRIAGQVTTEGGRPISGAGLVLIGFDLATVAGSNGEYTLGGVPAGSYTLRATAPGFVERTADLEVRSDLETRQDFELAARPANGVFITFTAGGSLWRIAASADAEPENLSARLDSLAALPGGHEGPVTASADGAWLLFRSERFDEEAAGWPALALVDAGFTRVEPIRAAGSLVHGEGLAAVAAGGGTIVYADGGGPHVRDLWIIERSRPHWGAPRLLTGDSPYAHNAWPTLSPEGDRVVFDGGDEPYATGSRAICAVSLDGSGFRVLVAGADGPGGAAGSPVHAGSLAVDGSLVFEAEWGGSERVWRIPPGGSPAPIGTYMNDNSPVLLADGRIASLWLGAAGGEGRHHIKVMDAMGLDPVVLLLGSTLLEVDDVGMGAASARSEILGL